MTRATQLADFARVLPALRFGDGSAATPGVGFTSQTNTGLFRPATSVLALSVNGTERLRASTTGVNVVGDLTVGGSPVYARTNLLGTVSQTAGVPTGAVIQRGSNANGEFVRFADGTQICVSPDFSGVDVTTASGEIFRTDSPLDWIFPATFVSVGSIAGSITPMGNAQTHWGTLRSTGSGSSEIGVFGPTSRTNRAVRAMAVGRWF